MAESLLHLQAANVHVYTACFESHPLYLQDESDKSELFPEDVRQLHAH